MVFQPISRTAPNVAIRTGRLLPHLFSLTSGQAWGGYSLLRYYSFAGIFQLRSMVLYAVRTFLLASENSDKHGDRTVYCATKIVNSAQMTINEANKLIMLNLLFKI